MKSTTKSVFIFVLVVCMFSSFMVLAAPGAQEDNPVVLKKYLDEQVKDVKKYVDSKVSSAGISDKFTVVEVEKGEKLIAGEGTELIVRQGKGKIISSEKGGIANVTIGQDLPNGAPIPANALLIVPLADGRGLDAAEFMLVMVKGPYAIE